MSLRRTSLTRSNRFWCLTIKQSTNEQFPWEFISTWSVVGGKIQENSKLISGTFESAISKFETRVKTQINKHGYTLSSDEWAEGYGPTAVPETPTFTSNDRPSAMLCASIKTIDDLKWWHSYVYVQPKLDGVRGILRDGVFYSRNGQIFVGLDHILGPPGITLDGELYAHDVPFNALSGLIRSHNGDKSAVNFHVFDIVDHQTPFEQRLYMLNTLELHHTIQRVTTYAANTAEEIRSAYTAFMADGYEGIIIRNPHGMYKNSRSSDIVKYKDFIDAEFVVHDITCSATGKEEGAIIFILRTRDGKTFNARPKGTHEERRSWWDNRESMAFIGHLYRVRYQELTEYGVPRFPVGIGFVYDREAESSF